MKLFRLGGDIEENAFSQFPQSLQYINIQGTKFYIFLSIYY